MNIKERKYNRLGGHDYSFEGSYFITTCIKGKKERLGNIKNNKIILNKYGEIIKECWLDLPKHYHNCELEKFIIMPNHFHGIIRINNSLFLKDKNVKLYSLSEIIRGFKSFSSKRINKLNKETNFQWQRSFYDRIIRSDKEYKNIKNYILDNPYNWEQDRNNQENLFM